MWLSLVPEGGARPVPLYRHQERKRDMGKRIQTATTSEYSRRQGSIRRASRILKLGEQENLTVDKLRAALRVRSLPTNGLKKDLASRLIEHQTKELTQGHRNL
jgi:hypothetical protein